MILLRLFGLNDSDSAESNPNSVPTFWYSLSCRTKKDGMNWNADDRDFLYFAWDFEHGFKKKSMQSAKIHVLRVSIGAYNFNLQCHSKRGATPTLRAKGSVCTEIF
jgi:hypothetical protein